MGSRDLKIPTSCADCRNTSRLFCGLTPEERDELSEKKSKNNFKKGQVVFYEGNHPHGLYCIFEGKVKLSKLGEDGREQILRFAGKGEPLGYRALLSDEPYNASATAMEDCLVCHLSRDAFMNVLYNNKKLSLNTIRLLTGDLKESEKRLINISQKTVKERVAEALLLLKKRFGLEENGLTLAVRLTRREIGEIAGVTTETTIRALSDFNKEQIIALEGKKINIVDLPKLIHLANIEN